MKNSFYKITLSLVVGLMINMQTMAQPDSAPAMADVLRSNGKIYVVVGVLSIVLTGLIIYLIALDRKLTAIEKKVNSK